MQSDALITISGCGTRASGLRKLDGRWKLIRIQPLTCCPGLG
jgi:hypothetical protein